MIVVAGIWEQGWFDRETELNLWHYPMKELGVDKLAMTPNFSVNQYKVDEFDNILDLLEHYNLPVILCTENGTSTLKEFEHPKDALYLFNRTSGGELPVVPHNSLRIDTKLNKGMLWGHQAASIILHDRFIKNGNNNSR